MIIINDQGIILKAMPFGESHLIVECFLQKHGIIKGLARVSKKQNFAIMTGNIVEASWKSRLSSQLGYYSFEVLSNTAAFISFDRLRVPLINSALSMIYLILNEREIEDHIYHLTELLLKTASLERSDDALIKMYVDLEIALLNSAGFGLDLKECVVSKSQENLIYISPKSGCAVSQEAGAMYHDKLISLPIYMLQATDYISRQEALHCLEVVGFFITKHILSPYGKKLPKARLMLLNKLGSN